MNPQPNDEEEEERPEDGTRRGVKRKRADPDDDRERLHHAVVAESANRLRARRVAPSGRGGYDAVAALRAMANGDPVPERTEGQQKLHEEELARTFELGRRRNEEEQDDENRKRRIVARAFRNCPRFDFNEHAYKHLDDGTEPDQKTIDFFKGKSRERWLRARFDDGAEFTFVWSTKNRGVDFWIDFLDGTRPRRTIGGNCLGDMVTVFHVGPQQ